jgi:hypothetical protein
MIMLRNTSTGATSSANRALAPTVMPIATSIWSLRAYRTALNSSAVFPTNARRRIPTSSGSGSGSGRLRYTPVSEIRLSTSPPIIGQSDGVFSSPMSTKRLAFNLVW